MSKRGFGSEAGVTLVELMVGGAILAILITGGATALTLRSRSVLSAKSTTFRDNLLSTLGTVAANPYAVTATSLGMPAGSNTRHCLKRPADGNANNCTGASLANLEAIVFRDASSKALAGTGIRYNLKGEVCTVASVSCPFLTQASFSALCPGASPCRWPSVVRFTFRVAQDVDSPMLAGRLADVTTTVDVNFFDLADTWGDPAGFVDPPPPPVPPSAPPSSPPPAEPAVYGQETAPGSRDLARTSS